MRHTRDDVRVKIGTTNMCMIYRYTCTWYWFRGRPGHAHEWQTYYFIELNKTKKKLYSHIKSIIHEKMEILCEYSKIRFFLLFNYNFLNLRWEWCRSHRQKTSHNPPWAILSPWISTKYILPYIFEKRMMNCIWQSMKNIIF